ncbi:MAG: tetratricopeptide repeat protein [Gemmatimonadota bacterium]|jgi:TolB-like protein/Flp pilus assembly protein TadD
MQGHDFLKELLYRRVPQLVGIYLAAGWGILEFTDWAITQWGIPDLLDNAVVLTWMVFFIPVTLLAWRWGAPGATAFSRTPHSRAAPHSVAVLPFANLSGNRDDDYLGDGLSEEIINALAKVQGLQVAARTSSFVYRDRAEDVRAIGRELNVSAVLEGSVQRSGNRLRVTTQLVSVADGYHLWSERFDREMEDVFVIEDQIAEQVARALRVILKNEKWKSPSRFAPDDIRAYEYYLRGHQFLLHIRMKSFGYAREMFQRSVEIDPGYAPAWAGLGEALALTNMFYPDRTEELEEADRATREAVRLAPGLAEAHAARGLTLFLMEKAEEAEEEFLEAIGLDPDLYQARYFRARALYQGGRIEEAAKEFQEAARIREDYDASFFAAQALETLGNHDGARSQLAVALGAAEKHMELNPDDPRAATVRAVSLCRLGRPEEGLTWAEKALEMDPHDAGIRYNVACLYSLEGRAEEALQCLEDALARGFGNKEWFKKDPDLDPLRDDPRFQALMDRI